MVKINWKGSATSGYDILQMALQKTMKYQCPISYLNQVLPEYNYTAPCWSSRL